MIMFVFIIFARQSNFNLCKCLIVCLYVIIIFKASEYLVTDQVKLSRTVQTNNYDLPAVKAGDFVNNYTAKQNNYSTNSKPIDAIEKPLKCKLICQIYIIYIECYISTIAMKTLLFLTHINTTHKQQIYV